MKFYKVVHQNQDRIIIEGVFAEYSDAITFLANSIYIDPFIIVDDGTLKLEKMLPEEVKKYALEHIEFQAITGK